MSVKEDTKVDRWLKWLKNHKIIAPFILLCMLVTLIGGPIFLLNDHLCEKIFSSSFTTESVNLVEKSFKTAIKDHPDHTAKLEILRALYIDLARREFQAGKYFAPDVKRYYTVENLRPCEMDSFYVLNTEDYQDPRSEIDPESFVFSQDDGGNVIVTFWQQFSCFRAKKSKYEFGHVFTKIIFDSSERIIYLNDEKIEELVYKEEREE